MSSLDLALDSQRSSLEMEWQHAYEASINALADYQSVGADRNVDGSARRAARDRLDKALAFKAWVALKIKCLQSAS